MNRAFLDVSDILNQIKWSLDTFGPGKRTRGLTDHIRKELVEIEDDPEDGSEWIDVLILALDGCWRYGYTPERVAEEYRTKMRTNFARAWPDWRLFNENVAIEHVRE